MTAANAVGQHMPVAEADSAPSNKPANGSSRDTAIEIDDSDDEGSPGGDAVAKEIAEASKTAPLVEWPLVRFIGGIERLIVPADFTINNADGEMEARRVQLPLILAYALSVHKSASLAISCCCPTD